MSERYAGELKDFAEVEANLTKEANSASRTVENATEVSAKQEEAQAPAAALPTEDVAAASAAAPAADEEAAAPPAEDPATLAAAKLLGQEEIQALEASWRTARELMLEVNAKARAEKATIQKAADARAAAIRAEFAAKRAQAA